MMMMKVYTSTRWCSSTMLLAVGLCAMTASGFLSAAPAFVSQHANVPITSSQLMTMTPTRAQAGTAADTASKVSIPAVIKNPVLRDIYPALVQHYETYGHPNIPLGTAEGRACERLRRFKVQERLTDAEVALLHSMHFRFYSLEQVYDTADFDDMFQRLLKYGEQHAGDEDDRYSPPKKYAPDPELGAWVTGIRRKGPAACKAEHVERLDAIGFFWTSPRSCGSQFMQQYRDVQEKVMQAAQDIAAVWQDEKIKIWVKAQQEAAKRGTLSPTRAYYMETLFSQRSDWVERERPWEA